MTRALLSLCISVCVFGLMAQSWQDAQAQKTAMLDLYWFTSVPFIYEDEGHVTGIEGEIMEAFADFLKDRHQVHLQLVWHEAESFASIIEQVKKPRQKPSVVGVSAFSITPDRQDFASFTVPYFPDIAVLVSSRGTPIVQNYEEINAFMRGKEAITIRGTSYERMLKDIRRQLNIPFTIRYIESDLNILDFIASGEDRFGFIDLPIYLMLVKRGGELTRQNFFTVKGTGYGYMFPKGSDWVEPMNQFFNDEVYKKRVADIISKYIGSELFEFMDNLYGQDQLGTSILTKEKELQLELIRNANLKLEEEQAFKRLLMYGMGVVAAFLLVIGYLFFNNQRTTRQLVAQNQQIALQDNEIRQINDQLINRNAQLTRLNEEKNNLVKILAHDMRSPLGQIIMLANMLTDSDHHRTAEERKLLEQIGKGAGQLNELIAKVLSADVLEGRPMKVAKEWINVSTLLHEMGERFQVTLAAKNMRMETKITEDVPALYTDRLLLIQIFENLLSNAIKFSPLSSIIHLGAYVEATAVVLTVADNGPGFSETDKTEMFKPFQKLSASPTAGETSTGLGLSIVKRYVDELDGKLWVETTLGKGSTFFIELPKTANE